MNPNNKKTETTEKKTIDSAKETNALKVAEIGTEEAEKVVGGGNEMPMKEVGC